MYGKKSRRLAVLPALTLMLCTSIAAAKDCPEDIEPSTTGDPAVPVEVLKYMVKPLTACELDAESQAWQALLRDKVEQVSAARIDALKKKKQARENRALDAPVKPEVSNESNATEKAPQSAATNLQLQRINELVADRTALIARFEVVLLELTAKGGDIATYDDYVRAVSGIEVDVTDANATVKAAINWLRSPDGGFRWAINIVIFLVLILAFYLLSILAGKATKKALAKSTRFSMLLREFLVMMARRLVLFVGFFVGLSALEVNVGPVLAIIGAAGFVIAFALQNSLSNFASGILMLLYRPFDLGDFVNVANVAGKVESMNLLSTQLRTPDNQLLVVPNNSVWGDVITNVTGITQRRVDLMFGIGYGDDIDKAQAILEQIVADHEKVLAEPKPVIKLHELGDSSVNFVCRPWVTPANYWEVYWDITREVKRRFDDQGVSIPFPQRDVHIYQEKSDGV